jgi:uncharacterized phage-associated protein
MFIDAVADSFILRGRKPTGEPITQLDLNKMAFYAHGWSLALRGEPLTTEPFIAYDGAIHRL